MLDIILQIVAAVASVLVFLSLFMRTIIALRVFSIASNLVFILFASISIFLMDNLAPLSILILHSTLLPLNLLRLHQFRTLIAKVKEAKYTDASLDVLIPFMKKQSFLKGEVLFKKGEKADQLYYLQSGEVLLKELGKKVHPPEVIGEIGVFSPFKERTATGVCETDLEAYTINEESIEQLFFQNPRFGYQLVQLILKRLISNYVHPNEGTCMEICGDEDEDGQKA